MKQGLVLVISCALAALPVASAWGQGRSGVAIRTPGANLGRMGYNPATQSFHNSAYGLGSLGSRPGAGTNVLRSSISSSPFTLRRYTGAMGASPLRSSITRGGTRTPGAGGLTAPQRMAGIGTTPLRKPGAGATPDSSLGMAGAGTGGIFGGNAARKAILTADPELGRARKYLHAISGADLTAEGGGPKVISSLIPSDASVYSSLLREGEKQFRMGEFSDAFSRFERASYIAPRAPETLLSLMHARFATSRVSYMAASHYLQLALKHLPELPLVPMRPKLFYGQSSDGAARYVEHIDALEKHLVKAPDDHDALLLLAYYRWFGNRPDDARTALAGALKVALEDDDTRLTEAVDTFWAAIVSSGKMSGPLLSPRPKPILRDTAAEDDDDRTPSP